MDAVQRAAVQRRAVEIGTSLGTKRRSKIAPISGREARPLQRLVGRQPWFMLSQCSILIGNSTSIGKKCLPFSLHQLPERRIALSASNPMREVQGFPLILRCDDFGIE